MTRAPKIVAIISPIVTELSFLSFLELGQPRGSSPHDDHFLIFCVIDVGVVNSWILILEIFALINISSLNALDEKKKKKELEKK